MHARKRTLTLLLGVDLNSAARPAADHITRASFVTRSEVFAPHAIAACCNGKAAFPTKPFAR